MSTLNRDIQLLDLARNNLTILRRQEFWRKNYRNLQKLFLNSNQLARVHEAAFFKLTGLIELDLSENLLSRFDEQFESREEEVEEEASFRDEKHSEEHQETSRNEGSPEERSNKSAKSFLHHLVQLRQLNLNSNQFTSLGENCFSPLSQLRQLFLSR